MDDVAEPKTIENIIVCMIIIAFFGGVLLYSIVQYKGFLDKPSEVPASILKVKPEAFKVPKELLDPNKNKPAMTTDLGWELYPKWNDVHNIATGAEHVYGIIDKPAARLNEKVDGTIIYRGLDPNKGNPIAQIPNDKKMSYIDAGKNYLWAFNKNNELYKCPVPCQDGKWTRMTLPTIPRPGTPNLNLDHNLMSVATNDNYVWITNNYIPFRCKEPCPPDNPSGWEKKGKSAGQLSMSKDQIWMLQKPDTTTNPNDPSREAYIGFCDLPCHDENWQFINASQDMDGVPIIITEGVGSWLTAKEPSSIWLTTPYGIYRCRQPCWGNWKKVSQMSVTRKTTEHITEQAEKDGKIVDVPATRINETKFTVTPSYLDGSEKVMWASTAGIKTLDPDVNTRDGLSGGEVFYAKEFF